MLLLLLDVQHPACLQTRLANVPCYHLDFLYHVFGCLPLLVKEAGPAATLCIPRPHTSKTPGSWQSRVIIPSEIELVCQRHSSGTRYRTDNGQSDNVPIHKHEGRPPSTRPPHQPQPCTTWSISNRRYTDFWHEHLACRNLQARPMDSSGPGYRERSTKRLSDPFAITGAGHGADAGVWTTSDS